jgi:hypothetical protein
VAWAELKAVGLAAGRNDINRLKVLSTNGLHPVMNYGETGDHDRLGLRQGLAAEPEVRGEDQGCQETKHEKPVSPTTGSDARSLHLTNVPGHAVFAFASDPPP